MAQAQEKHTQRKLRTASASTVISISLVLFMLGILGLILVNAQRLSNYVKENIGFTVMLKEEIKEVDVLQFQKTLDASQWVKSSQYVSSEEAAAILQKDLGEDFISFLGYNPLTASIDIHLHANHTSLERMNALESELSNHDLVSEVVFQKDLVDSINQNVQKVSLLLLSFCLLLLIIAVALINNTIRLSVYSKRFLIRTMKLVGATHGFIRKPFLASGLTQGIFGALIGILLLMGPYTAFKMKCPSCLYYKIYPLLALLWEGCF